MSTKLSIQIDSFDFNKSKEKTFIETESFTIKRNKKFYTITSHNFLPIKNNIHNDTSTFSICVNSKWNELLILNSDIVPEKSKIFNKISSKLPNIGSIVFINNRKVMVHEFCFYNFAFLPKYPKIVYIKIKYKMPEKILSGTPIYNQDRIIGLVSFSDGNYIYCLPSYYIIKTFEKRNKIELPDYEGDIVKINRNLVKNSMIYNPYLGLSIPVSSYFLLESNRQVEITLINYDMKEFTVSDINFIDYYNNEIIINSRKLIKDRDYYQVTSGTIHLLKKTHPDLCRKLFSFLNDKKNINDIKFKLKNNSITIKC